MPTFKGTPRTEVKGGTASVAKGWPAYRAKEMDALRTRIPRSHRRRLFTVIVSVPLHFVGCPGVPALVEGGPIEPQDREVSLLGHRFEPIALVAATDRGPALIPQDVWRCVIPEVLFRSRHSLVALSNAPRCCELLARRV